MTTRNWTGTTCKLIEVFGELLLSAAHPNASNSSPTSEASINHRRCLELFRNKKKFMDLFCVTSLPYGPNPTETRIKQVREVHAKKVEAAGIAYVKSLAVLYPECEAYYPHVMAMHCGDDVRKHGCPVLFVQEADEAKNLESRNFLMNNTNNQLESRLRTVMEHYAVLDFAGGENSDLNLAMQRKFKKKMKCNERRRKTTHKRVQGKLADLNSAASDEKNKTAKSITDNFQERQVKRTAVCKAMKKGKKNKQTASI